MKLTCDMRTRIFFCRHGTVYNPKKIWYGRLPFYHLSIEGKLQIENTAKYLQDKNIDIIYSSPLLRTKQSAEILKKKLGLNKIYFSKEILEVKSSLQGQPEDYLASINHNLFASADNNITGETLEDLFQRIQRFVAKITQLHKGKRIAVVSHGDPVMAIRAKNEELPVTIDSIRPGKGNYIKPGEIYLLTI